DGVGVAVSVRGRVIRVELVLDRDFDTYDPAEEEQLLRAIRSLLRTAREVPVRGRRRGSVILTLELSEEEAEELATAVTAGAPAELGGVWIKFRTREAAVPTRQAAAIPRDQGTPVAADPALDSVMLQRCVERWQAGDRTAADELLRVAGTRLEKLARRMCRNFPNVRDWTETSD